MTERFGWSLPVYSMRFWMLGVSDPGAGAGNGVYRYGPTAHPDGSYNGANYWADVVFAGVSTTPAPVVTDRVSLNTFAPVQWVELGDLVQAKLEYEQLLQRYPSSEWYLRAQQALVRLARR